MKRIIIILILLTPILVSNIFADESKIPEWVKNIFVWYGDNKISEDEVINAIKFLIENKIIQIDLANLSSSDNGVKSNLAEIWLPKPGTTWNWQLDTPIDTSFGVDMYDVDLFDNDKNIVELLHLKGKKVVCYVSVGSWEEWRPDANQFPQIALGKNYDEWPGEKWLDIRKLDIIGPIIEKRFDLCKEKGFDAIEPDNIDAYLTDTGFPLTYNDQKKFNIWLANEAHKRGLSIGLKNDFEQVNDLLPYFDWALVEDCFVYEECHKLKPFIDAGKAVFQSEYTDFVSNKNEFCPQSLELGFSAILKDRELTTEYQSCR